MSREDVGARLARLLAVIPWIASQPNGVTREDLAAQFKVPASRIEKDLMLLLEVEPVALSNVTMYEEDGRWYVDNLAHLAKPLRLTASDAFALVAAAQLMLQVPGVSDSGAFASAIAKVAKAIGGGVSGLQVELPAPPALATLRGAIDDRCCVEIEYYAASRDAVTSRVVEPLALFTVEGRWHLVGFCRMAGAERDFRVDRVRSVAVLEETFEWRVPTMRTDIAFNPTESTPVRIEVQPEQRWAIERYPVDDVEELDGGVVRFTVKAAGDAWLERLLLRLGPTARVLEPESTVGADVARRLLAVYEK